MSKNFFILCLMLFTVWFLYSNKDHLSQKQNIAAGSSQSKTGAYNFYSDGETNLNITALEKYSLTAMVVSKKHYIFGWNSKIAPYDLALVWGRLMDQDCLNTVSYSQNGRWYYYRYNSEFPLDNQYIISHSSNNHIIPGTYSLLNKLDSIEVGQIISLEGYLVNIEGNDHGHNVWWHSSLTRNDSGDGSCELFYINKLSVNGLTYI